MAQVVVAAASGEKVASGQIKLVDFDIVRII